MGKQVLKKCLKTEPQSELTMWTSLPSILAALFLE